MKGGYVFLLFDYHTVPMRDLHPGDDLQPFWVYQYPGRLFLAYDDADWPSTERIGVGWNLASFEPHGVTAAKEQHRENWIREDDIDIGELTQIVPERGCWAIIDTWPHVVEFRRYI
jgi:hypothetical protein